MEKSVEGPVKMNHSEVFCVNLSSRANKRFICSINPLKMFKATIDIDSAPTIL